MLEKIPQQFKHICDKCGKEEITKNGSLPIFWQSITLNRVQYEGAIAVGGFKENRDLCRPCFIEIDEALEIFFPQQPEKLEGE